MSDHDELFQIAVLAYRMLTESGADYIGVATGMRELDHYLANDIDEDLWWKIHEGAVRAGGRDVGPEKANILV